jgi:Protein of unknown function (DUF3300)
MRQKPSLAVVLLLISLIALPHFSPFIAMAQVAMAQDQPAPPPPTAAELDQLLAPVALYPDSLLSQITTASTNPQEILDVSNWLQDNSGLTGTALTDAAQQAGFDPAFIALVNFPQVIDMMAEHVDDYAAIGDAFNADQGSVAASIQRLRAQAYGAGTLRSTSQQQVEVQQQNGQTIYVIQPASPQVVYVPQYDPTVVYAGGPSVGVSLISFGVGIGIGALIANNQPWGWGGWGWNWGSRRAYYNHSVWGGWGNPYRPPNYWYRPRPIPWNSRPGYGGNWRYRPPNYRPPYQQRPPAHRPPWGPGNRPGGNRPGRPNPGRPNPGRPNPGRPNPGRPNPGRPNPGKPGGGRPTNPGTKPGTPRPTPRPQPSKPGNPGGGRPTNPGSKPTPTPRPQPSKPGNPGGGRPTNPGTKPGTSPTTRPTPRPTPQPSKPAPRPTPQPSKPANPGGGMRPTPSRPAPSRPAAQPKPAPQARPQPKPQQQARPAAKPQQAKPQPQPKG